MSVSRAQLGGLGAGRSQKHHGQQGWACAWGQLTRLRAGHSGDSFTVLLCFILSAGQNDAKWAFGCGNRSQKTL